jgi:hypothetical protein
MKQIGLNTARGIPGTRESDPAAMKQFLSCRKPPTQYKKPQTPDGI